MDTSWILRKANAVRDAWYRLDGKQPSDETVELILLPAIHETRAGDAWPGFNWGASILRVLNSIECAALAGTADALMDTAALSRRGSYVSFDTYRYHWVVQERNAKTQKLTELKKTLNTAELAATLSITPTVRRGHELRARAAQAALVAADSVLPQADIHCDSAPGLGAYFVWFGTFENDVEGAFSYLRRALAGPPERPRAARAVLLTRGASERQLATAMYAQHYFAGFYPPKQLMPDGRLGADHNIDDYAAALSRIRPSVHRALAGGIVAPLRRSIRLGSFGPDVAAWESIVYRDPKPLEWVDAAQLPKRWPAEWEYPRPADEDFDDRTALATEAWQAARGLKADGWVGPKTWAKAEAG